MTYTEFTALPFVTSRDGHAISLWAVQASGDWAADNTTGRGYADALIRYMGATGDAGILGLVARAISETGRQDGVQAGFWTGLGQDVNREAAKL